MALLYFQVLVVAGIIRASQGSGFQGESEGICHGRFSGCQGIKKKEGKKWKKKKREKRKHNYDQKIALNFHFEH